MAGTPATRSPRDDQPGRRQGCTLAVIAASEVDPDALVADVVACIGTDPAIMDLVPRLLRAGHRVEVFEDRPRLILPDAIVSGGPAGAALLLADALGALHAALARAPVPARLRHLVRSGSDRAVRRAGSWHRRRLLDDRWLRRQLTPTRHEDRPALRNDTFYRIVGTPACPLISWPIATLTPTGIRTCDGLEHRVDAVIFPDWQLGPGAGRHLLAPTPPRRRRAARVAGSPP